MQVIKIMLESEDPKQLDKAVKDIIKNMRDTGASIIVRPCRTKNFNIKIVGSEDKNPGYIKSRSVLVREIKISKAPPGSIKKLRNLQLPQSIHSRIKLSSVKRSP